VSGVYVKYKIMLYTGKGDNGTTKLFDCKQGERVNKSDFVFDVLGSLDELNSSLGFSKALSYKTQVFIYEDGKKIHYSKIIERLQQNLFCIQAQIGGSDIHLSKSELNYIEKIISDIENLIPPIKSFIIPGGGELGAHLDVSRTVARGTERKLVTLRDSKNRDIDGINLIFLNRLSSILYAMARFANYQEGFIENKPNYK
jgi:cob(I)alamin adenosyltransferase